MTDPKSQRLVQQLRALFAFLEAKYSISPRHKADVDDCIERLEDLVRETGATTLSRVH